MAVSAITALSVVEDDVIAEMMADELTKMRLLSAQLRELIGPQSVIDLTPLQGRDLLGHILA